MFGRVLKNADAAGAAGPYAYEEEEVYPEFHHNPTVVGPTPDGYYLTFGIGATNASNVVDCAGGKVPPNAGWPNDNWHTYGHSAGQINMGYSKGSPVGPWTQRTILRNWDIPGYNLSSWDYFVTTPTAQVMANGPSFAYSP